MPTTNNPPTAAAQAAPPSSSVKSIAIDDIVVPSDRQRALQPNKIVALSELMQHPPGLLHPIVVQSWGGAGYKVIAGVHRLEAAKVLGWELIAATCGRPIIPEGLRLSPIQRRILEVVDRRGEISPRDLADAVWADDPNGGPLDSHALVAHVYWAWPCGRARAQARPIKFRTSPVADKEQHSRRGSSGTSDLPAAGGPGRSLRGRL